MNEARQALAGERAWLVGGALRDRLLGREVVDVDIVVDGDAGRCREEARPGSSAAPSFELSDAFGAWRVIARDRSWQADITALRGGSLEADLALRDFTINAMAEPLEGGPLVDPFGGEADLAARRLRAVGERSFADDPLRVLRLARLAVELGLEPDDATLAAARAHARGLERVSPERIFAELRRIVVADEALEGIGWHGGDRRARRRPARARGARGIEQTVYHHRDAYGHTLEVLERAIEVERDPAGVLGDEELGTRVAAFLAEPLADELTRAGAPAVRRAAARRRQGARRRPRCRRAATASRATTASATRWSATSSPACAPPNACARTSPP